MLVPRALLAALAALIAAPARPPAPRPAPPQEAGPPGPEDEALGALAGALAAEGVLLDPALGTARVRASVLVREDLLEYLLTGPGGAAHETLFVTDVRPSVLNAAVLALGVEPGENAVWVPVDPPPTLEERRAGRQPFDVRPPRGDGVYLYAAWREGDEVFFYRVEDLLANLVTGRSMRRHRWVFLGSAFVEHDGGEAFAADLEENLINVALFRAGRTLVTCALPECVDQSIWVPNAWLVPPRDSEVELVLSREPLDALPAAWRAELPEVAPQPAPVVEPDAGLEGEAGADPPPEPGGDR